MVTFFKVWIAIMFKGSFLIWMLHKLSCNHRYIFLHNVAKMVHYADFCFVSYLCLLITKLSHSKSVLEDPKNIKEHTRKLHLYTITQIHLLFCHILF